MTRRREVFAGMTARELRLALAESRELRVEANALREHLNEARDIVYDRIGYPLRWLLQEGASAHTQKDDAAESCRQHSSFPQHQTQRDCDRWQIIALRKIIAYARPEGIDLEALEYDVARWAQHPNTLGYIEAQQKLFAARAQQIRRENFGLRAPCPLCGGTPDQDNSGYAWPEGLSRHLEGRGNVGRCNVLPIAFAACREATRQAWISRERRTGAATCHPDAPAYEYGQGECRSCYDAAWNSWHESIEAEISEWTKQQCHQTSHSWSPDVCVRCGAVRCKARYFDGQRCADATPCGQHSQEPLSLSERRRRNQE